MHLANLRIYFGGEAKASSKRAFS